jgi:hypothetical protein
MLGAAEASLGSAADGSTDGADELGGAPLATEALGDAPPVQAATRNTSTAIDALRVVRVERSIGTPDRWAREPAAPDRRGMVPD